MERGRRKISNRSNTILDICKELSLQENLRVTVTESLKGSGIVAAATLAGGLLGGKPGLVLGGTLGSLASYLMTSDFQSVVEILQELTPEQKWEFTKQIGELFRNYNVTDVASGMVVLAKNRDLKRLVLSEMSKYFKNELGMSFLQN